MVKALHRAVRAVDRLIFPRTAVCQGCGDLSGCDGDWLCAACRARLATLWRGGALQRPVPPLDGFVCAYAYRQPVPGLVRALKYGPVTALAGFMAGDMARACAALEIAPDVLVVPAPMHPRRERKRGCNQAALLSGAVAALLGLPHDARALLKRRNTRQQARLGPVARRHNLEGSVGVRSDVRGRRILLVDDVYTTGATMSTCAQALKDAGAATVWALTYAVAGNQPDDECPPMP